MSTVQPNPDPAAAPEAVEYVCNIPPGIRRSQEAFRRDLPQLLANKKLEGQWVAYHGDERIGIARSARTLYRECYRRGLKDEEFDVCRIEPEEPDDLDCTPFYE